MKSSDSEVRVPRTQTNIRCMIPDKSFIISVSQFISL